MPCPPLLLCGIKAILVHAGYAVAGGVGKCDFVFGLVTLGDGGTADRGGGATGRTITACGGGGGGFVFPDRAHFTSR